jgi:methylthioribose-1-phosphate isomerase
MPDYKSKSIVLLQGVFTAEALSKMKFAKSAEVFICEGRPSLEAGKLNAKVLLSLGVTPRVICDNMAGFLFFKNLVKEVRLACQYADQGGALCDTGALICAVLAKRHKVPVKLGQAKIKTRFLGSPKDILSFEGTLIAPKGAHGYVLLVEWVPGKYLK